jgi:hypothetical protein
MNPIALDRLKSQLLVSGIQQRDNALYQVINQLIGYVRQLIDETEGAINDITGGGGVNLGQTFVTTENELASLPSSRRIVPGSGINIHNDTQRLIIGASLIPGIDGEDGNDGLPGPQGPIGLQGIQGLPGPFLPFESEQDNSLPVSPLGNIKEFLDWQTYNPVSATGITALGDGSLYGEFTIINKTVVFITRLAVGATTTFSGALIQLSLPVPSVGTFFLPPISVAIFDNSLGTVLGGNAGLFDPSNAYGYALDGSFITGTNPVTLAAGDQLIFRGFYRRE